MLGDAGIRLGHTALNWDPYSDPRNLTACVADAAAFGFMGIETGGEQTDLLEELAPGELREALHEHDIVMAALYQDGDWTDPGARSGLIEDAKRWSERLRELGGDLLMVVPGEKSPGVSYGWSAFEVMAETMNLAGQESQAAGVRCAMHPHWGTVVETRLEIDTLLRMLDNSVVGFAPDSGQIAKGGADPVDVVNDWKDRVQHVHLKDVDPRWPEMRARGAKLESPEGYCTLGDGIVRLEAFLDAVINSGFDGWIMAEIDETDLPPLDVAKRHARFLRTYGNAHSQTWEFLRC